MVAVIQLLAVIRAPKGIAPARPVVRSGEPMDRTAGARGESHLGDHLVSGGDEHPQQAVRHDAGTACQRETDERAAP